MKKLQKIDEISFPDHPFIKEEDECYFILSYTSHKSYNYSDDNNTIINLKKTVDKKGTPEYKYKEKAIKQCAEYLMDIDVENIFSKEITLVPIPPSKCKEDPLYDDRLIQILKIALGDKIDIKELIVQKESTKSVHFTEARLTIDQIKSNYKIDDEIKDNIKDTIILFDDVLTTGAHYVAAKEIIAKNFPEKRIIGLFIARRVFEEKGDNRTAFDLLKLKLYSKKSE